MWQYRRKLIQLVWEPVQDSAEIVLSNSQFIDIMRAEHFVIKLRKRLEFVSNMFNSNMKRFWVHVSSSPIFVVVVVFSNCILTKCQDLFWYHSLALVWRICSTWSLRQRWTWTLHWLLHPPHTGSGYVWSPLWHSFAGTLRFKRSYS